LPPHVVSAASDVPAPQTMLSFITSNFKKSKNIIQRPHDIAIRGWNLKGVEWKI